MLERISLAAAARALARIRAPLSVKLYVAFLSIVVVLLATAVVSLMAIGRIERQVSDLDGLDTGVGLTRRLDHSIVVQEHLSSMLLLTGEESYYAKLAAEQQRFHGTLTELAARGATSEEVGRISAAFGRYREASEEVARLGRSGAHERARELHVAQEHVIAHEIEALTRDLVARVQDLRQAALARILREQRAANWTMAISFLLSTVLAVVLGSLLARSIVHPIQRVHAALARIASGELVKVSDVVNQDELGSLVAHVNRTGQQLADLVARERQATRDLQAQFESLRRAQAQLIQTERLRALGEMTRGVAHDFNNRLAVILGQAEVLLLRLEDGELTADDTRERLDTIVQAALETGNTVRRLLEFTRATPGPATGEAVDVETLGAAVIAAARPRWKDEAQAAGRPIEVVTEFRDVSGVAGDASELREVLLSLVFNALDAMPHGGTLTLAARREGGDVLISVRDTGIGMTDEIAARVFEPFFTTKGPRWSGLGLSVSYGVVRRHGGDLTVVSRPGGGTTFTIRLPAREAPPPRPRRDESEPSPARSALRVLVVDDESAVRRTLRDMLAADGHHVWEAQSGPEALAVLERESVDLVCTDLGMPGMTGWQVAERIRAAWPAVKVALVTGWAATVEPAEVETYQVDFLLGKPFRRKEVRAIVSAVRPPEG